jgi:hypothetical protein
VSETPYFAGDVARDGVARYWILPINPTQVTCVKATFREVVNVE